MKNALIVSLALVVGLATAVSMFLIAFAQNKPTYCGQDHEHTLQCYSDPQADVETEEEWQDALPEFAEDEPLISRLVNVAKSQLGYRESTENYEVQEDGELAGYTRYGAWAGSPYARWNVPFVNFCLANAGIDEEAFVQIEAQAQVDAEAEPEVSVEATSSEPTSREAAESKAESKEESQETIIALGDGDSNDGDVADAASGTDGVVSNESKDTALLEEVGNEGPTDAENPAGQTDAVDDQPVDDGAGEAEESRAYPPASAEAWEELFRGAGLYVAVADAADSTYQERYMPAVGSLVFLQGDNESGAGERNISMAIVVSANAKKGQIAVVQGDVDGRVERLAFRVSDSQILGYGQMPQRLREEQDAYDERIAEQEAQEKAQREAEEAKKAVIGEAEEDSKSAEADGQLSDDELKDSDAKETNKAGDADESATLADGTSAKTEGDSGTTPVSRTTEVPQILSATTEDGYQITADLAGQAEEGYELRVERMEPTEDQLSQMETSLTEELPNGVTKRAHVDAEDVALFDIAILDELGREVEPAKKVRITVVKPDPDADFVGPVLPETEASAVGDAVPVPDVFHFSETKSGTRAEAVDAQESDEGFSFTTKSFSPFAFVFTVDFEYDGYIYNLEGNGKMPLSELIRALSLDFSVSDVMLATFSNPELLSVQRVSDDQGHVTDWQLTSLLPFATAEVLSITLKTGEIVSITVTDSQHITDLSTVITRATLSVDGTDIQWPALVREGSFYDLRLEFKENSIYQFVDDETAMSYALPRGISIGDTDFERTFTMDVGDGVRLANNLLQYNAELRTFFIVWNTSDAVGFNKLKASAVAEFRVDLEVQFDFNPDKIDFGNDVFGEVIRDTSVDVDLQKTGSYNPDDDQVDYEVQVTSRGAANGVEVRDVLFGEALTFIQIGGNSNGVTWESSLGEQSTAFESVAVALVDAGTEDITQDIIDPKYEAHNTTTNGFQLTLGQMQDGEVVTLRYSAKVDYDKLKGSGTWSETYNLVSAAVGDKYKTAEHSFEGEMRYVELKKSRDQVNWGDSDTTNVHWTVRVNNNPKVSLAGTTITDTIYAGDVEALEYVGDGLHVRVYNKQGVFMGEYDVPWSDAKNADTTQFARKVPRVYQLDGKTDEQIAAALEDAKQELENAQADLEAAYELGGEEGELEALKAATNIKAAEREIALYNGTGDPYQNQSWAYTIPNTVSATNGSQAVTIDNANNKYYYDISYITEANKTKMIFDGYVGNEVTESRTNNLMQGGLYPPGIGTVPSVSKEVDKQHEWADKGSDEDYIYWKISFDRQPYNLTRCVIEDDNPTLYGRREEVDVGTKPPNKRKEDPEAWDAFYAIHDGTYRIKGTDLAKGDSATFDILWVEGLRANEGWQIASATNTRTTFRFYQKVHAKSENDKVPSPGLQAAHAGEDNTITIYLRTKNNAEWIEGTMTKYWSRDHTNSVTWIPNAHQVGASATTTPAIRKMEKVGKQVGSVKDPQTGVMLPVFRYEIYLTGLTDDDFQNDKFEIKDTFNTDFLQFVEVTNFNSPNPNSADLVSHKFVMESTDQQELGVGWWDQCFKGYSKENKWVGPVRASVVDNGPGGAEGVKFVIQKSDFTDASRNRSGYEPGTNNEYCMRYSLPYYLVVKDANAAQKLAQLPEGEYEDGEYADIKKTADGKVNFKNTAEWGTTTLTTETDADADFNPMSKTLVYDASTDTCTYTIIINSQRLKLNNGETVCVRDSYTNLAVDFLTVATGIETVPKENKSQVDWAYHNNVGTFWIPDETMVTITYTAKPIGDPGKSVTFSNTVSMLGFEPRSVLKTVKLNSESEGSAGDYNIRLFKFADNNMNHPLEGAVFQLYEEDATGKVPVKYASNNQEAGSRYAGDEEQFADYELLHRDAEITQTHKLLVSPNEIDTDSSTEGTQQLATNVNDTSSATFPTRENHQVGDYVYFCTTKYGYADIHLNKSKDGIALERGKQYYLKEIVTPDGYTKEDIWWSFIIDDMDYFDNENGVYVYRDGGVLTVANSSSDSGIVLRKKVTGDVPSWSVQKGTTFEIEVKERDTSQVVYRRTTTYEDFAKDNAYDPTNPDSTEYRFKIPKTSLGNLDPQKTYVVTVTESNADVNTHTRVTTTKTQVGDGDQSSPSNGVVASTEVLGHVLLDDAQAVRFWFTNTYTAKPIELTVHKTWGQKAQTKYNKAVEFVLYSYGLKDNSETEFETKLIKLSWDSAKGAYEPNESEPGNGAIVLDGTETDPWSKVVAELPRYDHKGNAYVYSVMEVSATYADNEGEATKTVTGEDLDTCFTITATDPTQKVTKLDKDGKPVLDDEGHEVLEDAPLPMSGTTAQADVYGKLSAEVNFSNEIATLIPISVEKSWDDIDTDEHHGEDLTFDLYRTTGELPTGGAERKTYKVSPQREGNGITIAPGSEEIEAKEGDIVEVTYISTTSDNNGKSYKFRFAGLSHRFDTIEPSNPTNQGGQWNYRYDAIRWFHGDVETTTTYTPGSTSDIKFYFNSNNGSSSPILRVQYRVERLDNIREADGLLINNLGNNTGQALQQHGPDPSTATVSVVNITQANENLTRQKLQGEAAKKTAQLVRSNVTLEEAKSWKWSAQFPRDDGKGHEYTYFVLEHPVAGYTDSYKVSIETTEDKNDEDPRGHTITIANAKDPDPDASNPTQLTVAKEVAFNPAVSGTASDYDNTPFYFTVKNGNRYVVNTQTDPAGDPVWKLMSPAAYLNAGLSPYIGIKPGDSAFAITGLPEGSYVIEEFDDDGEHDADIEGYTRETTYNSQTVELTTVTRPVRTIKNTYTPIPPEGSFTFSKLWTSQPDTSETGTESDSMPVEWPNDVTIRVTLHRRLLHQGEGHAVASEEDDEHFLVTYDIQRSYNAASNQMVWNVTLADVENKMDGLKVPPVITPPNDAGRFFNYAFTVTGVEKTVTRESTTYDCKYYVTESNIEHYQTVYGGVAGAAPYVTPGATYADEGKAIINQFEQASITFTKEWYGQNKDEKLVSWPTRIIEKDPESDEGANPDTATETEPVPITLRLSRKLKYEDGLNTVESKDFDPTYDVVFPNLTDAKTYSEIHPDEGKITLTMSNDAGSFKYTINRLQKYGSMTIDGVERHGEWVYYVFENNVDGYQASFFEPDLLLGYRPAMDGERDAVSVGNDGLIKNTQLLGTMALQKQVLGVDLNEDKTFEFVVRRKSGASTSLYLLEDGSLVGESAPHVLTLTVSKGKTSGWLNFQDVIPGEYEVRELGTIHEDGTVEDGGVAHMPGYDLHVTPTREVPVHDDQTGQDVTVHSTTRDVTLRANSTTQTTFTNTYELKKTNMQFQKVWLGSESTANASTPQAWPTGESITIELHRKVVVDAADSTKDVVDDNFVLVYEGTESGGSITWTAVEGASQASETDADQVLVSRTHANNVQNIRFENLTQCVLEGEHAGEDWTYYLVERPNLKSVYGVHYGKVENEQGLVVVEDDAAIGTEVAKVGNDFIVVGNQNHSAIINRVDYATAQIAKVWQDSTGTPIEWPKDGGGADIPITIIATGTKDDDSTKTDEKRFVLTSAAPKAADRYTYTKDDATQAYTFTFYGLELGYTYTFAEATLAGYERTPTDSIAAGQVITNTKKADVSQEKTSVTVKKKWDDMGRSGDKAYFRLFSAVPDPGNGYVQFNVRPEFYYANGDPAVPNNSYLFWINVCGSGSNMYYKWKTGGENSDAQAGRQMRVANNTSKSYKVSTSPSESSYLSNYYSITAVRVPQQEIAESVRTVDSKGNVNYVASLPSAGNYKNESEVNIKLLVVYPNKTFATGRTDRVPSGKYDALPDNAIPTAQVAVLDYGSNNDEITFDDLPAYDEYGRLISYYIVEDGVYTATERFTVTYEHTGNDWTVTNTPTYQEASFTKKWYGADGTQAAWPKDASNHDLPVTVRVTRRLAYEEDGKTKYSADQSTSAFSLTYDVTSERGTLTHVNGKTATAEDQTTYAMEVVTSGNGYTCAIAKLDNVGTLAVGGANKTGKWDYRFEEISEIDGYEEPAYYDASATQITGAAAKVPDGGLIRNVQEPAKAKFAVTKRFKYGDAHWPDDGFTFTLAYDKTGTEAREGQSGIAAPQPDVAQTVTITKTTASSRKEFNEVAFTQAGTYLFTICETVPDDAMNSDGVKWTEATPEQKSGSSWFVKDDIRYYHKPSTVTAVVLEENGALKLGSVAYNANGSDLTAENIYAGKVGFDFAKVWLKPDASLPASEFVAWPANETINLVLERYSDGNKDADFAIAYTGVQAASTSVVPTSVTIDGTAIALDETTTQTYTLTRINTAANLYEFSLPDSALDSLDSSGNKYVYRMVEMDDASTIHGEYALKNASGLVYATSRKYAEDGGVVVNRDNTTSIQVTKIWQDVQGVQESAWPSGKSLALTLGWSAEGGATGSHALNGVGNGMSGESKATTESIMIDGLSYEAKITVTNNNPALITIEGLPYQDASKHKYTYTIEETPLPGYTQPTYSNLASQSTSSTVAYDGATITNRAMPAEQTVPFEVTKRLVLSSNPSTEASEAMWPDEGFSFTLAYVGYKVADSSTGNYDQDFLVDGYYDNTGYPLLSMPEHERITITKDTDSDKQAAGNDHKGKFGMVKFYKAGTYYFTIAEDATTNYYRGDSTQHKVKVTVTEDGGVLTAGDPVYYSDADTSPLPSPIITNQYKALADATFSKVWLPNANALPTNTFEEWPADKSITVKLVRYENLTKDGSFEITYEIGKDATSIVPTNVQVATGESSVASDYTLSLTSNKNNVYTYETPEALTRKGASSIDYQYFFTEPEKPNGYVDAQYGTMSKGTVTRKRDAVDKIQSGGVIANAKEGLSGGPELPSTGGSGVAGLYALGFALLALTGVFVAARHSRGALGKRG